MTISALIIDDEQLAREELKYLLDSVGGVDAVSYTHLDVYKRQSKHAAIHV